MEIKKTSSAAVVLFSLVVALLVSCKKESQTTTTSLPVVEAYLMAGHPLSVKLYYQKSLTDTAKYGSPITGQELYVSDGSTTIKLTETARGTYLYSDTAFLTAGKTYALTFTYLLKDITAKTVMPAKPQNFATQHISVTYSAPTSGTPSIDTLNKFSWTNPDSLNHVLVFYNINDTYFPVGNRMPGAGVRVYEIDTKRKSVYYITTANFSYYGSYKVILLSVNQEYINLLNSNTSGSNSQNLLNIPTNVVNGLGIFTSLQADTLTFNLYQ
jgi:hypothetical protein